MGGFLQGVAGGLIGAVVVTCVVAWRVSKCPGRATTFERAWTQTGDERDDAVLTRSLAVLGLLALLLLTEVLVGATTFAVIDHRS